MPETRQGASRPTQRNTEAFSLVIDFSVALCYMHPPPRHILRRIREGFRSLEVAVASPSRAIHRGAAVAFAPRCSLPPPFGDPSKAESTYLEGDIRQSGRLEAPAAVSGAAYSPLPAVCMPDMRDSARHFGAPCAVPRALDDAASPGAPVDRGLKRASLVFAEAAS